MYIGVILNVSYLTGGDEPQDENIQIGQMEIADEPGLIIEKQTELA